MKKYAGLLFKTTYKNYGGSESSIERIGKFGINGHFTDHLSTSGMIRNCSLNTTVDRDRWLNGSKDWMEHLN